MSSVELKLLWGLTKARILSILNLKRSGSLKFKRTYGIVNKQIYGSREPEIGSAARLGARGF